MNTTKNDLVKQDANTRDVHNETHGRVIRKHFEFLWHAERFQNRLYNKYDSVTLVEFPRFSDAGEYAWRVS